MESPHQIQVLDFGNDLNRIIQEMNSRKKRWPEHAKLILTQPTEIEGLITELREKGINVLEYDDQKEEYFSISEEEVILFIVARTWEKVTELLRSKSNIAILYPSEKGVLETSDQLRKEGFEIKIQVLSQKLTIEQEVQ